MRPRFIALANYLLCHSPLLWPVAVFKALACCTESVAAKVKPQGKFDHISEIKRMQDATESIPHVERPPAAQAGPAENCKQAEVGQTVLVLEV